VSADDDLAYLVTRLRQVWSDVVISVRGDCGCGVPALYEMCERLRVFYTFGLSGNAVLQRQTTGLLAEAVATYARSRQEARQAFFTVFFALPGPPDNPGYAAGYA
jgi:hypothetical protein